MPQLSPRIAVVDDDEAVLRAVSFALEAEGYRVDGFSLAQSMLDSPFTKDFQCLVVDQRLPDGDGLWLIRRLRLDGVSAPAVVVTTQPDARCRRDAAAIGVRIIEKPLMGDVLSEWVRAMTGGGRLQ